jgi:hypothetical protein
VSRSSKRGKDEEERANGQAVRRSAGRRRARPAEQLSGRGKACKVARLFLRGVLGLLLVLSAALRAVREGWRRPGRVRGGQALVAT